MEKCTTVHASTETYDISGEHREMNEEQLPVLLNVIPDVEDGRMGKEVTSPRGQMPFCNSNKLDLRKGMSDHILNYLPYSDKTRPLFYVWSKGNTFKEGEEDFMQSIMFAILPPG